MRQNEEKTYFCAMKKVLLSVLLLLLMLACQQPPDVVQHDGLSYAPMEAERLPDLVEPRTYHALVWAGDHILAIGGHTTGFVPTATAEYYSDGRWHSIPMLYTHDSPFALTLKNGNVMVGGGYEKPFGVGQTWGVEVFHPETHSFSSSSIMDRKRARASALELKDGEILICGNWYGLDVTERYHSQNDSFTVDTATEGRNYPFIIPVGATNVYIFSGSCDSYGGKPQYIVDQLDSVPFTVELFEQWHPCAPSDRNVQADAYRMTDNTFLILAINDKGQFAPMVVDARGFSLLPLNYALPNAGPWGTIHYTRAVWTQPENCTAWLMGFDDERRVYLAEIQYEAYLQGNEAELTMHYSQPIEGLPNMPWELLLPDGSFVTVGGGGVSNYQPDGHVFAFYPVEKAGKRAALPAWGFVLMVAIGLILLGFLAFGIRKFRRSETPQNSNPVPADDLPYNEKQDLSTQITALMEEQKLFKNKDLRIADMATALGTNTTYISASLNGTLSTTFPAFVMSYRIRYAQDLMRKDPRMRLSQVAEESGFTNEKTFLRAFKASCGLTPSEWKQQHTARLKNWKSVRF